MNLLIHKKRVRAKLRNAFVMSLLNFVLATALGVFISGCATRENARDSRHGLAANAYAEGESKVHFIDLSRFSNGSLDTNWLSSWGRRTLAEVPRGVHSFAGTKFLVQSGLIQLRGTRARPYPNVVAGIPVQAQCARLHFLHGTGWSVAEGTQIGAYVIHFADGSEVAMPIVYGLHLRDWDWQRDTITTEGTAWNSTDPGLYLRLYKASWDNPKPMVEIKAIDFVAYETSEPGCAPFLIAVTAE